MLAVIRQVSNPGVGDGIHDGADTTDDCHDEGCVEEKLGQSGVCVGGNEEGQKISGNDTVDQTSCKVAHAQGDDLAVR